MTQKKNNKIVELVGGDKNLLKELIRIGVQEALEAQMTELLGADRHERSEGRRGYRSGYYKRNLTVRVGKIELRVPQDRDGQFSTELFDRYQRTEKALVSAMMEMYVQGVSTRKVTKITEKLCGTSFSPSTISRMNKRLDEELESFHERRLSEPYPYVILDARYERVREDGVVRRRAVLVAIGVNWQGQRCVLGVTLANRESTSTWKEFISGLKDRGLHGVEFVVSDNHQGLKRAVAEMFQTACWQRCYVHFLRNALDHVVAEGGPGLSGGAAVVVRPSHSRRGATGPEGLAPEVAGNIRQAVRVGRGEHRGDLGVLPAPAKASQAHALEQPARAGERGNQAPYAPCADVPERGRVPQAGASCDSPDA